MKVWSADGKSEIKIDDDKIHPNMFTESGDEDAQPRLVPHERATNISNGVSCLILKDLFGSPQKPDSQSHQLTAGNSRRQ